MAHPHPQPQSQPTTSEPPKAEKPGGFAVTALVLGIVSVVLSFMPIFNNFTAAGGFVGAVLGIIGIWKSKRVMSIIGIVLCVGGIALTVVAQNQLSERLGEIINENK